LTALLPVDLVLSLLAKRSFTLYRFWYRYREWTDGLFDSNSAAPNARTFAASVVEQLRERGFAILPTGFSDENIAATCAWVLKRHADAKSRAARAERKTRQTAIAWNDGGITYEVECHGGGRTRLHFSTEALTRTDVPEVIRRFADLPDIRALCGAYFARTRLIANLPYLIAEVIEPNTWIETWHIDCIRPTLKVFLTLANVTEKQGPLRVVPGSHKVDAERHRLFYRICNGGLGHAYFDRPEFARYERAAVSLVAPANRFIVFDNRGVHAGSFVQSGLRIVLANGYRPVTANRLNPRVFRDPEPVPYPWERLGGDDWNQTA